MRVAEGATKNDPFEFEWPVSGGGGPRDRVQATAVASNFQLALACVRAKSLRWRLMSCEPEPWLIAVSLCGCFCAQCHSVLAGLSSEVEAAEPLHWRAAPFL